MLEREQLQIGEFMTKDPICISTGKTVAQAAKILDQFRIGSLVVLNEKKELVGIFTSLDVVYDVVAQGKNPDTVLVDDIMVTDIVNISPQKTIQDAMTLMSQNDIRQLPVLVGKKLVGFVTMKDILRIEPSLVDIAVDSFRAEEKFRQNLLEKVAQDPTIDVEKLLHGD